ncbi:hypothetical protein BC827DRAFT_131418 [Russula dissimulans]|nr:hypothetical protein BC827DRAFT_131418 [Russula dissimulans]
MRLIALSRSRDFSLSGLFVLFFLLGLVSLFTFPPRPLRHPPRIHTAIRRRRGRRRVAGVPPPAPQTMPSRSLWLKTTLKLPTQTEKPSRAPRAIHKAKDLDSDIESEDDDDDDDDDPYDGDGKRPLTTRQAALASVVGSSCKKKQKYLREDEKVEKINYIWGTRCSSRSPCPPRYYQPRTSQRQRQACKNDGTGAAAARVETTGHGCLGCGQMPGNEYGLVRDWERSGCVMEHLHLLESRLGVVAV